MHTHMQLTNMHRHAAWPTDENEGLSKATNYKHFSHSK